MMLPEIRDEFLSEEDLELRNMTAEELFAYWEFWLLQAQTSNELDEHVYSHGVFIDLPEWPGISNTISGNHA